jgi:hypothetical protein
MSIGVMNPQPNNYDTMMTMSQYGNTGFYNPSSDGITISDMIKKNEEVKYSNINQQKYPVNNNYPEIKKLAKNINESLSMDEVGKKKKKKRKTQTSDDIEKMTDEEDESQIQDNKNNDNDNNELIMFMMEPILLLTIYVIMSQQFFLKLSSKYIPCMKPNEEEIVGMNGIIMYGIILTLVFLIIRKIIQSSI